MSINISRKFRTTLLFVLCIVFVLESKQMIFAENTVYTYISEKDFSSSWEVTVTYYSNNTKSAILVCGYNTTFINEDYAWSRDYKHTHQAGVVNNKGMFWGKLAYTYKWSKIEVFIFYNRWNIWVYNENCFKLL